MPGPGTYTYKNMNIGTETLKYTLKSRVKNMAEPEEVAKKEATPGPGMYRTIEMDSVGKYTVSNIPNSKAQVWSPAKSKRFKDELRHTFEKPEPCTYNPSDTHSMNDSYILSTFKNPGIKRIIPSSIARTAGTQGIYRRNATPGPGTYILPSDFGVILDEKR